MKDVLKSEPVRAAVYSFVALLVAYLVRKGVVDGDTGDFVVAGVTLILGAITAETARANVTPIAKAGDDE